VSTRQRRKEATEREHKTATQHVTHEGKEERIICQNRNQQRDKNWRDKNDVGREPEDPRTLFRHDFVLVEQLP